MRKLYKATDGFMLKVNGDEVWDVTNVTLPDFQLKKPEITGAGRLASQNIVTRVYDARTLTIAIPRMSDNHGKFKARSFVTVELYINVVGEDLDVGNFDDNSEKYEFKGTVSKTGDGKIETATTADSTVEIELSDEVHYVNGNKVRDWSPRNMIDEEDGEDLLAQARTNMGR